MQVNKKIKLVVWMLVMSMGLGLTVPVLAQPEVSTEREAVEIVVEDEESENEGLVVAAKEAAGDVEGIDYYLPYPGILPDHPLYWLKMVRDRVQLWLTTKPLSKAEKMLLSADKRLGAGWALVEGNKVSLGVTTLTKAEKYLERTVVLAVSLGEEGRELEFKQRLGKAMMKHEEVLGIVADKAGEEHQPVLQQMLEMVGKQKLLLLEKGSEAEAVEVGLGLDFGEGEPLVLKVEAGTAFEALVKAAEQEGLVMKSKQYDIGMLVEEIDGRENSDEQAWIYYVNGKAGEVAADKQELSAGDEVEWRYEEPMF